MLHMSQWPRSLPVLRFPCCKLISAPGVVTAQPMGAN